MGRVKSRRGSLVTILVGHWFSRLFRGVHFNKKLPFGWKKVWILGVYKKLFIFYLDSNKHSVKFSMCNLHVVQLLSSTNPQPIAAIQHVSKLFQHSHWKRRIWFVYSTFWLTVWLKGTVSEVKGSEGQLMVKIKKLSPNFLLKHEFEVYSLLEGVPSIPHVHEFVRQGSYQAIYMENTDPSLALFFSTSMHVVSQGVNSLSGCFSC